MKYGLLASLLTVLSLQLYVLSLDTAEAATTPLATAAEIARAYEIAKSVPVDPGKPQLNLSSMARYSIHAQCARLAYWAGYYKLMGQHMATAEELKPKSVPQSDFSYRFGFVDGQITAIETYGPKLSYKQIAKENYAKICPKRA